MVKHLGHEVPRGAGVEAKAVNLHRAGTAADIVLLLEHGDVIAFAREQGRRGETGDATADDNGAGFACG